MIHVPSHSQLMTAFGFMWIVIFPDIFFLFLSSFLIIKDYVGVRTNMTYAFITAAMLFYLACCGSV